MKRNVTALAGESKPLMTHLSDLANGCEAYFHTEITPQRALRQYPQSRSLLVESAFLAASGVALTCAQPKATLNIHHYFGHSRSKPMAAE